MTQFINDLTGYLRDLLVIKTAEYPENILQYSPENISLMRQESELFEETVIIRYIKVLSELSNRLRYAVQKRLLVEIEIIRLCRPQMDLDRSPDSLLNRIAIIEKRLESGVMPVSGNSDGETDPDDEEPQEDYSNIQLSDRIKAVVANWKTITAAVDNIRERYMAQVFKLGSADGEKLIFYVHNSFQSGGGSRDFSSIKKAMEKVLGYSVDFEVVETSKNEFIKKDDLSEKLKLLEIRQ